MKKNKNKNKNFIKNKINKNINADIIDNATINTIDSKINIYEKKFFKNGISRKILNIKNYVFDVRKEFNKIIWPDKKTLLSIFFMVISVSFITSIFFMCSDFVSYKIINFIISGNF